MKKILPLLLLLPLICGAQGDFKSSYLEVNKIDEATHDTIKQTYWRVLEHSNLTRRLTTFFRLSRINGAYYLDLKILEGGSPFVVAKNAEFNLKLERNIVVTLYNLEYQQSCMGCGAKGFWGSDAQGVTLSFRIYGLDLAVLMNYYLEKIRLCTADRNLDRNVNYSHSERFMDELYLIYDSNKQQKVRIVN